MPLGAAVATAAAISALAWAARALTPGGAAAALSVGTLVLAGTGWQGGAVLAAFFVSSTTVGRISARAARARTGPEPGGDGKGECRDAWQVFANGGTAALAALAGWVGWLRPAAALALLTVSLAAAAADTWATAFGTLSRQPPRLLGFGRRVPAGTNGGMSLAGTAAGLAGAAVVAASGALANGTPFLLGAATLIGFGGMAVDSIAGAVLQGRFRCVRCDHPTERRVHRCGTRTAHVGGVRWLTNDGVNFLATAAATLAGAIVWSMRW